MPNRFFVTLTMTLLLSLKLIAGEALTFGAEFTFTNHEILAASKGRSGTVNIAEAVDAQAKLIRKILASCKPECTAEVVKNSYGVENAKITFPDGFWFIIATDPAVIEVQTKPSTLAEFKSHRELLQKYLFDFAKDLGLFPHSSAGGGHIHIGFRQLVNDNLQTIRNIFVDFANHSELATGIWGNDNYNAPAIAELPQEQREAFKNLIHDVDSGAVNHIFTFISRLKNEVYNSHSLGWAPHDKYQALNITRAYNNKFWEDEQTVEVRAFRPQRSANEFIHEIELLDGRMAWVKHHSHAIKLNLPPTRGEVNMLSKEMFESHMNYVAESGIYPKVYLENVFIPNSQFLATKIKMPRATFLCERVHF